MLVSLESNKHTRTPLRDIGTVLPPGWLKSLGAFFLALSFFIGNGCAEDPGAGRGSQEGRQSDPVALSVERLHRGDLLREMKEAVEQGRTTAPPNRGLEPLPRQTPEEDAETATDADALCASVPLSLADPQAASGIFQRCVRARLAAARAWDRAVRYFQIFRLPPAEAALSARSLEELRNFHRENRPELLDRFQGGSPRASFLRNDFPDEELQELERLVSLRRLALEQAQEKILELARKHSPLVAQLAAEDEQFALLRALVLSEPDGVRAAKALAAWAESHAKAAAPVAANLEELIYPFAFSGLFSRFQGNPFLEIRRLADLGGSARKAGSVLATYREARARDNPPLPARVPLSPSAIRVAIVDTGVDFVRFPDLGLFLGDSWDYADDDANPYLPSDYGGFSHGSETLASLLTVISHYAPGILQHRKLDIAVWKVQTLRQLLAGDTGEPGSWESRHGLQEALVREIEKANTAEGRAQAPRVVSISSGFELRRVLDRLGKPGLLNRAPWLWVMAAGNGARDARSAEIPVCLGDVPPSERPRERILCVGAVERGIVHDQIAAYSNFGEEVDVYGYESSIKHCPEGTSCATPSVAAAAAIIAATFPELSAEKVRNVIMESAELKTLKVAGAAEYRKVRLFDPSRMLVRALRRAGSHRRR